MNDASHVILPIVKYCGDYLKNIAFYDSNRKCYMFFDEKMLLAIRKNRKDVFKYEEKARTTGESFVRFNSFTIECEKLGEHLIVPITVFCSDNALMCNALLDTGASITMLSNEVASRTIEGETEYYTRESFNTANGVTLLPVVTRKISLEDIQKTIKIAINENDESNILGLNFFKGFNYVIDFPNTCIYIWE